MTRENDDEALSWEGDDDPTLAPGWKRVGNATPVTDASAEATATDASAESAATADSEVNDAAEGDAAGQRRQTGSVELLIVGVLAGVYLLYTVGWLLTVVRTDAPGTSLVADAMYTLGLWLAVLAPALWFGLVFAVVSRSSRRLLWLAVGAVVLVPLPFVLGVTA
ncbi:DNA polymerase III subunit gamma/tau [Agromyces aerolatus]|uniref:DNA polymerase III subunit gamma/tau n=1 Tax=Agromyces sp. LY-1074 TaxID=3074080 RepID=UPI0028552460|nr:MULTISPECIES: DNA polymerase III subunit gamma/tau [unclassified Agromyces]MDR5699076.1 DNA polymerase III subunit gamma/tau [Agromyces sp. LY-1074]MDR5705146.1 DNA polymerase III subunit gamma/tau [Agromyces sp. LY-1358]